MAPHIRSHRAPCSCFPKKMSLQLSSEQSVGDVRITQLDWKRVPQARSPCKSSVAITTASRNVSWPQRAPSAVGHETAVVCQVERRLPGQHWRTRHVLYHRVDSIPWPSANSVTSVQFEFSSFAVDRAHCSVYSVSWMTQIVDIHWCMTIRPIA